MRRKTTMRMLHVTLFAVLAAVAVTGCTKTLKGRQLSEYCAIEGNADKDLCAVNGEIQKTRDALAVTDKTANEAKSMAASAQSAANAAQATATEANSKTVNCTTNTLKRVKSGSCAAGYTLVGCTQTHYTKRAGGMAILRQIDESSCTYNARVLEVAVRCCQVGAPMTTAASTPAPGAKPTAPNS
jgi:hypothetical protein